MVTRVPPYSMAEIPGIADSEGDEGQLQWIVLYHAFSLKVAAPIEKY